MIMKTAEEILESHLSSMLSRTGESYVTIEEMKQVPEWEICIKAVEQAQKEAYNQAIDDAAESAVAYDTTVPRFYSSCVVDKQSILKLKI